MDSKWVAQENNIKYQDSLSYVLTEKNQQNNNLYKVREQAPCK
jgi:hypothetical protein